MNVEIDMNEGMVLWLGEVAFSLDVEDYPVRCKRNKRVSWIDFVMELLASDEMPQLGLEDKVVIFSHLDVDEEGLGYVCGLLGITTN